jgi:ABC-type nickel/cobalt efflux system permease component RcnA
MKNLLVLMLAVVLAQAFGPIAQAQEKTQALRAIQNNQTKAKAPAKKVKIRPGQLLVRPKSERTAPALLDDPRGWVQNKQRVFYRKMARAMGQVRLGNSKNAAWLLMFLSFVYGVLHAAGPGHGKAVVSAWLLANEQQLRRGIVIAAMAALVQAITAILLVSALLGLVVAVGTKARFIAAGLTASSFAMIGLVGLFLIYQVLRSGWPGKQATTNIDDRHHLHNHNHNHVHDEDCQTRHTHAASCDCGHAHMPGAAQVSADWSWRKAFALAFAVGIRPCSGAILVLLLSSGAGIYWAGIASTFAMAIGTGITVSLVAVLAVTSKNLAVRLTGGNTDRLARIMFFVKLLAGAFIALTGTFLFWAALPL